MHNLPPSPRKREPNPARSANPALSFWERAGLAPT